MNYIDNSWGSYLEFKLHAAKRVIASGMPIGRALALVPANLRKRFKEMIEKECSIKIKQKRIRKKKDNNE